MVFKTITSGEAVIDSAGKAGQNSSVRYRRAAFIDKEVLAECRGSMSQASLAYTHMSPFQFTGSYFFSINALTLTP